MSKKVSQQRKIIHLWTIQFTILMMVLGLCWLFADTLLWSVLAGGIVFLLPNAYFALFAFRYRGALSSIVILKSMYRGEFGKILLTGVGFALAFVFIKPLEPVALFSSYIGMILTQWWIVSRW